MSSLSVDYIKNTSNTVTIPVVELKQRVVQYYQAQYSGGEWNPTAAYQWVPGLFRDFTPRRSDTRIKFTARFAEAWVASSHAISNWYFFANGILYYYWSSSGTHIENGKSYEFEVPSWGTTTGRIGLQMRAHANDNNETRIHTTYYWNGTGRSVQNCVAHLFIEEILN
jgi:hypothetical protein